VRFKRRGAETEGSDQEIKALANPGVPMFARTPWAWVADIPMHDIPMRLAQAMVAAGLWLAWSSSADAACQVSNVSFDLTANQTVTSTVSTDGGGCGITFRGGVNTAYTSITVTRRPRNGTIAPRSNGFAFNYQPRSGFKGSDAFAIKACGTSRGKPGCVTVNYAVAAY
jgi:hypothetical protein